MKQQSTIIDCSKEEWRIIRQGAIKIQSYNSKFKNNTSLLIDTSSNKEITVKLKIKDQEYMIKRKIGKNKAQVALPTIDKLLNQQGLTLKDLTSIRINTSSGSFTGIRVGMAIANALSFALEVPVKKFSV